MKLIPLALVVLFLFSACKAEQKPVAEQKLDVFGIKELYSSKTNTLEWTSEHWHGSNYAIDERIDSNDPNAISGHRGTGTLSVNNGELVMGGSQPRLYVYPMNDQLPWSNVEVTMYYQRIEDADTDWAGAVIGIRSGEEGHSEQPCDAHTYYARVRQDGTIDFAKELKHSDSTAIASVAANIAWPETSDLPFNTWIGLKFVAYNNPDDSVVLKLFRDMTEGTDGGRWELINSHIDDGKHWAAITDCPEHQANTNKLSNQAYLGGGSILIRNTDITRARYKWLSIREIE